MCLYIKSSAFLVISFIKVSILTLGKWSSCYCLLLWTQIDFSLASMKRSCAWALIDHFQCARHNDKRKTLRKPETAKQGQSAEALSSECLQFLPGLPLTESAWFFWLIQVGNGWGSTKYSRISRYNTLDWMIFKHPSNLYEPMVQFLQYAHYKSKNMQILHLHFAYAPMSFQHHLSFDCHQYFLAHWGFISPL